MPNLEKRLGMLRDMRKKHIVVLRANQADPGKDEHGAATKALMGTLRFLAVADHVVGNDCEAFRTQMRENVALAISLFERFDQSQAIPASYVSMMAYKVLFNALACGDRPLAIALARHMGGRPAIEADNDRPFDQALGYALKALVCNEPTQALPYIHDLEKQAAEVDTIDFMGYATALKAIATQDPATLAKGLTSLLAGHKRQCRGRGLFTDTEDEVLCVWGLGILNLARMQEVDVGIPNDPLIPAALVI